VCTLYNIDVMQRSDHPSYYVDPILSVSPTYDTIRLDDINVLVRKFKLDMFVLIMIITCEKQMKLWPPPNVVFRQDDVDEYVRQMAKLVTHRKTANFNFKLCSNVSKHGFEMFFYISLCQLLLCHATNLDREIYVARCASPVRGPLVCVLLWATR
jgi:hypothetical protein